MKFLKGHTIEVAMKVVNAILGLMEKGGDGATVTVNYQGQSFLVSIKRVK